MTKTAEWIAAYPDLESAHEAIEIVTDRVDDADVRLLGEVAPEAESDPSAPVPDSRASRLRHFLPWALVAGLVFGAVLGLVVGVSVAILFAPASAVLVMGPAVGAVFGVLVGLTFAALDALAAEPRAVCVGVRTYPAASRRAYRALEATRPLRLTANPRQDRSQARAAPRRHVRKSAADRKSGFWWW
ncbi:MAG: hypothetical protein QOH10_717 [Actinomycetota bacterium]|nr:hypothetical protein [Actinomycetota bacterium]